MSEKPVAMGPKFEFASDRAIIALGHSERKMVGEKWASEIDNLDIFEDIDVVTINRLDRLRDSSLLKSVMKKSTVFGHSAASTRIDEALQFVAINPPEPASTLDLLKAASKIANDPIEPEVGSHKTGLLDLLGAGLELADSPTSSISTIRRISGGYSAVEDLIAKGEKSFPEGRAIVHSELDGFGFSELANMHRAAGNGITAVEIPNHYHNEVLFAPKKTIGLLTPSIFPEQ